MNDFLKKYQELSREYMLSISDPMPKEIADLSAFLTKRHELFWSVLTELKNCALALQVEMSERHAARLQAARLAKTVEDLKQDYLKSQQEVATLRREHFDAQEAESLRQDYLRSQQEVATLRKENLETKQQNASLTQALEIVKQDYLKSERENLKSQREMSDMKKELAGKVEPGRSLGSDVYTMLNRRITDLVERNNKLAQSVDKLIEERNKERRQADVLCAALGDQNRLVRKYRDILDRITAVMEQDVSPEDDDVHDQG